MHEHNNSYLSGIHDFEWMMSTLNVAVTQLILGSTACACVLNFQNDVFFGGACMV